MVKVEGTNRIPKDDPYLLEYFQKLLEISFTVALEMYDEYNSEDETNEDQSGKWLIEDREILFKQLYSEFLDSLFQKDKKLAEEVFIYRFEKDVQQKYL